MFSIRKVMISIMVFILSIVGVKADPGNYVLKFGVNGKDVCSDCNREFSETNADIFHCQYVVNSMLFSHNYDIIVYQKGVNITKDTHFQRIVNLGILIRYGGNGYWDARPQAFIDLDESPQKYRCLKCMVNHAEKNGNLEPIKNFNFKKPTIQRKKDDIAALSRMGGIFFDGNGKRVSSEEMSLGIDDISNIGMEKCLVCTSQDCCIVRDDKSECMVCKKTEGEKFVCPGCLRIVAHIKCLKDNKFKCGFCKDSDICTRDIRPRMFVIPVEK